MQTEEIWIAEDDLTDRRFLERALRDQPGCQNLVHFFNDGLEIVQTLQDVAEGAPGGPRLPSLIILDLAMPRMNGHEALAAIKSHPTWKNVPVVVLATSSSEEDIRASYREGANSFITKPFGYHDMRHVADKLREYWLKTAHLPYARPGVN
jgi:CheY-like chemotaxis protein